MLKIPTIVIDISNGLIHNVMSNQPVRVIFLDSDTEGGNQENIHIVNGEEVYVQEFEIDELTTSKKTVRKVEKELENLYNTTT